VLSALNRDNDNIFGSKLLSTTDGWATYTTIDLNVRLNARKRLFMPFVNVRDSGYNTSKTGYVVGSARFNVVNIPTDRVSITWMRESSYPPVHPIVTSKMWDGNGLAITTDGKLLATYSGGTSWTAPTTLPLGDPDNTVSTVLFISNTTWLMGVHSFLNFSVSPTSPQIMITRDGGQTVTTVCSFPSSDARAPMRQIVAWQPSGIAQTPDIYFVHQFTLYQWAYDVNSCGTKLLELTPTTMQQDSALGLELLALGCNPNPTRGCLLMAVNRTYDEEADQSKIYGWSFSYAYTHQVVMYTGCPSSPGSFSTTVTLPAEFATASTSDYLGANEIIHMSENNVFMYSAMLTRLYAASVDGGATWVVPSLFNLDDTSFVATTASVWNATMLYFGVTQSTLPDQSFLVRLTYTSTGVEASKVSIESAPGINNLFYSLRPTTITFQSPFQPEYASGGSWSLTTCASPPTPTTTVSPTVSPSNSFSPTSSKSPSTSISNCFIHTVWDHIHVSNGVCNWFTVLYCYLHTHIFNDGIQL
jgi:hypothetical protein